MITGAIYQKSKAIEYKMTYFKDFDYSVLDSIKHYKKAGRGDNGSYNDCFIMFDTETSKKSDGTKNNHVCAWTISIRANHTNLVTLWGRKPSELTRVMYEISTRLKGKSTYMYAHNLAYDWVFIRQFMFQIFGNPVRQLSTKAHYPILFEFSNGLTLKDSLILAQRKLEKWANDLDVEHKKAVGCWDYDKLRGQAENFTDDELKYIECDTLAGVECLDTLCTMLNKHVYSMPYTATGIPREECRKIGESNRAHDNYMTMCPSFEQYQKLLKVYHGGYTHANRYIVAQTLGHTEDRDFTSSYPFSMIAFAEYPVERYNPTSDKSIEEVLELGKKYSLIFKLTMVNVELRNYRKVVMPYLQFSKCEQIVNPVLDNGRVISCDYVEIYLNSIDLQVIYSQYKCELQLCTEVEYARKGYLPRWFTDLVYKYFYDKTTLKGKDKVLYALAKAKLNSLYGMCVQRPVRELIEEDFTTGEYITRDKDMREEYNKTVKRKTSILPYQWGVIVTSLSARNLFELGSCVDTANGGVWAYSDTDSVFATKWDNNKLALYNQRCKELLRANGYDSIIYEGKEYCLGTAVSEVEDIFTEFRTLGAKRYSCRMECNGELKITVAGVPKKTGAKCLKDDINNFAKGFVFDGATTGKLTHEYIYADNIYTDSEGNETGDSINLISCDYLLSDVYNEWESILNEEVEIQVYE